MINAFQLLDKIALGEDSFLEFKSVNVAGKKVKFLSRDDASDEIAAFANHKGGLILLGVSDNREIQGVGSADTAQILKHFISEICHDSIDPPIRDFTVSSVKIPDEDGNEKILVCVEISQSLWIHKSKGGFFLRQGDAKREMTTEQVGRRFQDRSKARIIEFDEQAVPNTTKSSLHKDLYTRFLNNPETEDQENEQLRKLKLLVDDDGIYRASVAGLLMCSDRSEEYLYNSYICAVHYAGSTKDANYQLDAQDFKGPLDQQIIDAFKFVEKYNKISALKGIGRTEKPQYSMRAIFEALVNAVIHRSYSIQTSKIRLFLFSDRLELYSPGALANTITIDTLQMNQSTRNELLSRRLSDISIDSDINRQTGRKHFLERRGEGVAIIMNESEALSGKSPIYEMLGEELRLTIFAAESLQLQDR